LASLIFGNWIPAGVAAGAGLFGYADAIQLRSSSSVLALLVVAAIVGLLLALIGLRRRSPARFVAGATIAIVFGVLYLTVDTIPSQFVYFTPYVTTLFLLAVATQRLRPPEALGRPWRKRGAI
jgi:simple sugar transport system permease protein